MPSTDDQDAGDLIPIGSWDTTHPFPPPTNPTVAAHLSHGNAPRFSPKPFLGSDDASQNDLLMVQALELLHQLGVLSYTHQQRANPSPQGQLQPGTRLLIYAHNRQRPSNNESTHGRKATEKTAEAKKALTLVLLNINVDPWCFHNPTADTNSTGQRPPVASLFQNGTNKRLIDIYMEMPSPRGIDDPYRNQPLRGNSKTTERLLQQAIEFDSPRGMRTKLYQYQKNSLWKLLRRELCPDFMLDPLTVTLQDVNGNTYYLDLAAEEPYISRMPTTLWWEDVPGGIICEDMGTGKTCLCIALILHTLHQSGRPPAEEPVQLHCDIIPGTPSAASGDSKFQEMVLPRGAYIPSLRDFAVATIKTRAVDYRHIQDYISPEIVDTLEDALLYYHEDRPSKQNRQTKSRQTGTMEPPVEIYISNATLVIVPPNLIDQWCNEINKHTEDGALKVLTITKTSQEFPNLRTLLQYDLVLISQSRFAREYTPGSYSMKRALDKTNCQCSNVYDRCRCIPPRPISPLMQIRWKRIIVDEGHSMGIKMSDHTLHAEKLHADRRWICTGTPTTNLANLDPSSVAGMHGSDNNSQQHLQQMAESDKGDMDRLSVLVESFLHLPPYFSAHGRFSKELQKPFVDHQHQYYAVITTNGNGSAAASSGGPKTRHEWSLEGASSALRLKYLMDRIMVRNRAEDIARNVTLPPLQERIVSLDLEYFQVLALNCQIALIQANAVLSEREDQDYFLHPSSRKELTRVIENLKDGCFWYMGGFGYKDSLVDTLNNVKDALDKHELCGGTKYSREDYQLLLDISKHITTALANPGWEAIVATQEISYYCQDLPALVQARHAIIPSTSLHTINSSMTAEGSSEQRQIRNDAEGSLCVMLGKEISNLRDKVLRDERAADNADLLHLENVQQLNGLIAPIMDLTVDDDALADQMLKAAMSRKRLSQSTILSSTSSKLNYITSQILRHQGSEKCVVFCQNQTVMHYIREYLNLARVRCLMYYTGMTESEKSSNITTFNTSEAVSTIIMDTDLAAYGIDLSSASRVYFVSPVWKTATLRQAIKRAHRIGQIRPVFVETLVIRNSFEEKILRRRHEIDDNPLAESIEPVSSLSPFRGDVGESSLSASVNHRHRSRHQKRKSIGASGSASIARGAKLKKGMLDDGKVRDLIHNLEFMAIPPTKSLKDQTTKFRIPVVYPAKETAQAQQQLRMAGEDQDVPSVDDTHFKTPQNEMQVAIQSEIVIEGVESSNRKKLRFIDTNMESVEVETYDPETLTSPKQESNQGNRHQQHQPSGHDPSESVVELAAKEERCQKQELELLVAKEELEEALSRVRAAQKRLSRVKRQQEEQGQGTGHVSAPFGPSTGAVLVLDSDDDDEVVVVDMDVKKEEDKDVRLKFENIKLEGSSSTSISRTCVHPLKYEQEDRKVKFEVKPELYEDVKRPFTFKSDDNDCDTKDFKREQTKAPAEYYELFDYENGDGEDKKFKLEEGMLESDMVVVVDSDSDEKIVSIAAVTVVGLKTEVPAMTACKVEQVGGFSGTGGLKVELEDIKVDVNMGMDSLLHTTLQHTKRENSQPHHSVDLQAESRLKKRVRF